MAENTQFLFTIAVVIAAVVAVVVWYSHRQEQRRHGDDSAYLKALEYMVDGNERLALQKLKEAVHHDTENIDAYLRLGDLLRQKGMHGNAIRIHSDLTLRGGLEPDTKSRIYKSLLQDYQASGDTGKALEIAQKLLDLNSTDKAWVVSTLVDLQEQNQQWSEAQETVKQHASILPDEYQKRMARYLVEQGLQIQGNGNGKESRVKFKEALKTDPQCEQAYYYIGKSYAAEARYDDAIKFWKDLCFKAPDNSQIVFADLERTWFELGKFADAENLYEELLHSGKNGLHAGLALAEIFVKKGEYDNAIEVISRLENEFPEALDLVGKKINILYAKGQYKQAASQSLQYLNELGKTDDNSAQWG